MDQKLRFLAFQRGASRFCSLRNLGDIPYLQVAFFMNQTLFLRYRNIAKAAAKIIGMHFAAWESGLNE